jgi:hypothetical protein
MDFSTLNYKLRCNITDLHNRFSGWDGGNLRLNSADFSTSISGSTLTVQVRADISYSDSGFYTRSYAQTHFEEACEEYVQDILDDLDDDDYSYVSYRFSLSLSRK